jgi:hypothetical protein
LRPGKIDAALDRGSVPEGPRRLDDLGGKILGGGLVANAGPVDDDLLLAEARLFHKGPYRPDQPIEKALREAHLYANRINNRYPPKVNPIKHVLACNGEQFALCTVRP